MILLLAVLISLIFTHISQPDTDSKTFTDMHDTSMENVVSFAALGSVLMPISEILTVVLLLTAIALNVKKLLRKNG